ncbi:MAG: peptidase domain-containing ABC transporter [Cyanobacteria bacterium P01_A01_bin.84]
MDSEGFSRVKSNHTCSSNQESQKSEAVIHKLLEPLIGDTYSIAELVNDCVIRDFCLGDELLNYLDTESNINHNSIYFICQGQIQILGFDTALNQEVSIQQLGKNQTFGGDCVLCDFYFPYRAIAASDGYMVDISLSLLLGGLEQLTALKSYLQNFARQRQSLFFFKTKTELKQHSTYILKQLLPYLTEIRIDAGLSLSKVISNPDGNFWLIKGCIRDASLDNYPISVGDSWECNYLDSQNLIAEIDTHLYYLSKRDWESSQILFPKVLVLEDALSNRIAKQQTSGIDGHCSNLENHSADTNQLNSFVAKVSDKQVVVSNTQVSQETNQGRDASKNVPKALESLEDPTKQELQKEKLVVDPHVNHVSKIFSKIFSKLTWWQRFPFIPQQTSSDCGAACLAMVSLYWGKRLSVNLVRQFTSTDINGASLSNLETAAQGLGYETLCIRASLSKVESYSYPWIAHWQGSHYIVVWNVGDNIVFVSDPAIGKAKLSHQEFIAGWTGYALLISPTTSLQELNSDSEKSALAGWREKFWCHRSLLSKIIFVSLLIQIFKLGTPAAAQLVLDGIIVNSSISTINLFTFMFLICGSLIAGLTGLRQYLLNILSRELDISWVSSFVRRILALPLEFFTTRTTTDIISRIQENRNIQLFTTRKAVSTILDAPIVLGCFGLMGYYNLGLTLLVLVLLTPIVVLKLASSPLLKTLSRAISKELVQQNSFAFNMIAGIDTIKVAAVELQFHQCWEEVFISTVEARYQGQKLINNLQITNNLANYLLTTSVLWWGSNLVINNKLSIGEFVAFGMLVWTIVTPISAILKLWDEFQEVLISQERVNDVLNVVPARSTSKPRETSLLTTAEFHGEICCNNLSFSFHPNHERNILENISLHIQPGQTVGLVGAAGCGKTTLARLLAGLYSSNTGEILIDGHNILHIPSQSLRSMIGFVPQKSTIFSGSILENITLYNSQITVEQAIAAAKFVGIHSFIQDLPMGYDTPLNPKRNNLSSGQRKQIAIARGLVYNPKILILDEAISFLDMQSANIFQQNLASLKANPLTDADKIPTTIIITHQLQLLRNVDYIFVLQEGRIQEQGNHQQLMTINGLYSELFRKI